jgi:hypothetical protein
MSLENKSLIIKKGNFSGRNVKELDINEKYNFFIEVYTHYVMTGSTFAQLSGYYGIKINQLRNIIKYCAERNIKFKNDIKVQIAIDELRFRKQDLLWMMNRVKKELSSNELKETDSNGNQIWNGKYEKGFFSNYSYLSLTKMNDIYNKVIELEAKLEGLLDSSSKEINAKEVLIQQVNKQLNAIKNELGYDSEYDDTEEDDGK